MKSLILLSVSAPAQGAFALSTCKPFNLRLPKCAQNQFLTNIGCEQFEQVRCVRSLTVAEQKDYVWGQVKDTLIGELDPEVLGDSGLLYLQGPIDYVIYEPLENPYLTSLFESMSQKGVVVGIAKFRLGRVTRQEAKEMDSLLRFMDVPKFPSRKPVFFEILD